MNTKKFLVTLSILAVLLAGTVMSVGAATPMHVSYFKASFSAGHIKATVGVVNSLKKALPGANVQLSFEKDGVPTILKSGMTNAYGRTTISSAASAGQWIVCVEEIHKLGYDYNPTTNLCTTVTVP